MSDRKPPHSPPTLAERYAVLLETARVLASIRTLDELYRETYRETARVLEADGFYISRLDEARDLARVVFYADEGREQTTSISYRASESIVLRTGEPALIEDDVKDRSILTLGRDDTDVTRSAITTPVLSHGRVAGAISVQSYQPGAYDDSDLELLRAIADIAAVAIENVEQMEELERRRQEAERIEEIGRSISQSLETGDVMDQVADAALDLLQAHGATLYLLDGRLARVGASKGRQFLPSGGQVELTDTLYTRLRSGEAVIVDDVRRGDDLPEALRRHLQDGSFLAVPIQGAGRVTGFLCATSIKANCYGRKAVGLLKRLGAQASVALENAELHARLQALSLTDPLTGLPNRRHLRIHLAKETAAAVRGRRLAVVIFDVDGFKAHNDARGHLEGDRALRLIAQILSSVGRAMNLVARFGGDEFISVLSESSIAGAELYAERVCNLVSKNPELAAWGLTMSYGIAVYDPAIMDVPDDLIRIADKKLYEAKNQRPKEAAPTP